MTILLYGFLVCCIFQLSYQFLIFLTVTLHRLQQKNNADAVCRSVSIIICARNEKDNLKALVPLILEQDHPDMELLIVDDGSEEPVSKYLQSDKRLIVIRLEPQEKKGSGKKEALSLGISQATKSIVLLTDADCRPAHKGWARSMTTGWPDQQQILLGISPYLPERSILNGLVTYETAQTALQYSGWALLKLPYMGCGRNVAYNRELAQQKKWTTKELSIASGDDDLMLQTLATKDNTGVCLAPQSYTYSKAPSNWRAWTEQKLRHYRSGYQYAALHRILLGTYWATKLMLYMLLVAGLLLSLTYTDSAGAAMYFLRFYGGYAICLLLLNFSLQQLLLLNHRWFLAPLYDGLYAVSVVFLGLISPFYQPKLWQQNR